MPRRTSASMINRSSRRETSATDFETSLATASAVRPGGLMIDPYTARSTSSIASGSDDIDPPFRFAGGGQDECDKRSYDHFAGRALAERFDDLRRPAN